jgi:isochorismate synthase
MDLSEFHFKAGDSFAAYSLPGEKDYYLIVGGDENQVTFSPDHLHQRGFVFHPFMISETSPALFIKSEQFLKNQVFTFEPGTPTSSVETITKDGYLALADQFIRASSGEFLKLVLSRTKTIENQGMNLYELFLALQKKHPNAFVYIFNHPSSGCWMGASPELLLSADQGNMLTVALAGTKLFNPSDENSYWSAKDRMEQDIVVQYVENTLKAHHLRYSMHGPEDHEAGKLVHLKTSFHFEAPSDVFGLIHHLHPTPAVCGLPKNRSVEYIAEHEKYDRRYYAGFLGPVQNEQKIDFFVNLRCMHINQQQFVLYAGSGIVQESRPEGEWEETERKFRTVEDIIESIQQKRN